MAKARANGIDIEYDTIGSSADPALLLVAGLGAQLVSWPDALCQMLVDRGLFVIRYDNRDVGLSTHFEGKTDLLALMTAAMTGVEIDSPYQLSDMAADGIGLLDALSVERAHVVGASMGAMIVQQMVIDYPERVRSLTSIMSTTGDADVGQPHPELLTIAAEQAMAPATTRDAVLDASVKICRAFSSKRYFDAERVRDVTGVEFDRCFDPDGRDRQLQAILASPSRAAGLAATTVPTLVIHGLDDTLIDPSGGRRTAELVSGARLLLLDDMGHDIPEPLWPAVVDAIIERGRG